MNPLQRALYWLGLVRHQYGWVVLLMVLGLIAATVIGVNYSP